MIWTFTSFSFFYFFSLYKYCVFFYSWFYFLLLLSLNSPSLLSFLIMRVITLFVCKIAFFYSKNKLCSILSYSFYVLMFAFPSELQQFVKAKDSKTTLQFAKGKGHAISQHEDSIFTRIQSSCT